jgi:uncharacterized membrane protein YdjX (TVP38/TMEM64 family)
MPALRGERCARRPCAPRAIAPPSFSPAPSRHRPAGAAAAAARHCGAGRLAAGAALLAAIGLAAATFDAARAEAALAWVQTDRRRGAAAFLLAYVAGVVLMLPAMVMAMAAGAAFGLAAGGALAWAGSSLGQVAAFLAGRYLLRDLVAAALSARFPKWPAVDRALAAEGWKLVTLLRLSPVAPWNVLNYALAATAVPLGAYATASSLAIIPYLALFVYFGSLARSLADVFTGAASLGAPAAAAIGAGGALAMVALVWYTTAVSRRAVAEALRAHGELPAELMGDGELAGVLGTGRELGDGGGSSALAVELAELGGARPAAAAGGSEAAPLLAPVGGVVGGGGGSAGGTPRAAAAVRPVAKRPTPEPPARPEPPPASPLGPGHARHRAAAF